jgi:hypothetical protein
LLTVDGQDDIQTNKNDQMNIVVVVVIREWSKNSGENEIRIMKDEDDEYKTSSCSTSK